MRGTSRALRASGAAAALTALTAGLPAVLYAAGGTPVPRGPLSWHQLLAAAARPEDPAIVLGAVRWISWLAWAAFTLCVATELAAGLRGRPARLAPGLAPLQGLAAALVTAILTGTAAAPAAAQAAVPRPAAAAPRAAPPRPGPAGERLAVYRVQPGDSLWNIAADYLGDGEAWHRIWALNKHRRQPGGGELTSPGLIQPGWLLRLPVPARDHPARRHPRNPAPRPPAGHPPRPCPPRPRPGGHVPPGEPGPGISLPSGSLAGAGLAAAVAAAVALAAVHRRRGYRPGSTLAGRDDPPVPPFPHSIAALRRAAPPAEARGSPDAPRGLAPQPGTCPAPQAAAPATPATAQVSPPGLLPPAARGGGPGSQNDPYGPPAGVHGQARPGVARPAAQPGPGQIAMGVRDRREICADLAALGGLGLTGHGATAAARAILAALLACGLPGSPHGPAEIILPAAAAPVLLPGYRPGDLAGLPGLTLAPSPGAALAAAEELILRRTRLLDSEPGGTGSPLPPAMLLATPDRPATPRLAAIAQAGRTAGVAVIVLGDWPAGTTCHITADGTASSTDPRLDATRLFHLTPADTTAVLTVLREACGQPPVPAPPEDPGRLPPAPIPETVPAHARPGPAAAGPAAWPAPAASGSRVVRVDVLGPLRITSRDTEITGGLRKARELIAFLAVHPGGATAEVISEALWPGRAVGQRNLALRKARDMLRSATGLTAPMWIVHASGRYHLDPVRVSTDLGQFTDALDRARHAASDQDRLAACREAAGLYRGELAEGAGYDWAEPYAETARRRALDAWTTIAGLLAPRDPEQALAALESALSQDPYNEFLYQKIMRLQAAAGRSEAVRRTLSLLETRLTDLGITPGAQTRQLAASLLGTGSPTPSSSSPAPRHDQRPARGAPPRGSPA